MIDIGILAKARHAVGARPRLYLTPSILLAVVMQESSGVAYFVDTKPGSLCSLNIGMAVVHKVRDDDGRLIQAIPTGLKEFEIRDLIRLPEMVGDWKVPRDLVGRFAKFRFEYGYWVRYAYLEKAARFRMSCSWGLTQFMGPNIIGKWQGDNDPANGDSEEDRDRFIRRFAGDLPLQLLYGAGEMERLLRLADGDLNRAYRGYNSGNINSKNAKVIQRANAVVAREQDIAKFLRGNRNV